MDLPSQYSIFNNLFIPNSLNKFNDGSSLKRAEACMKTTTAKNDGSSLVVEPTVVEGSLSLEKKGSLESKKLFLFPTEKLCKIRETGVRFSPIVFKEKW